MKKNGSLIIVAVVALAIGYLLGSSMGSADSSQSKGDINAVNTYHQLLISPDYMSFNKGMEGSAEVLEQTISTLQIVEHRISGFSDLAALMNTMAANEPEVAPCVEQFLKANVEGKRAMEQANDALNAAIQMKAGEKVNTKKALKNAEAAMAYLDKQMAIGKQYVETVDGYLKDKNVQEHIMTATLRDLVVSHCAVNANLVQNDSEIDYWSNMKGMVESEDMAVTLE